MLNYLRAQAATNFASKRQWACGCIITLIHFSDDDERVSERWRNIMKQQFQMWRLRNCRAKKFGLKSIRAVAIRSLDEWAFSENAFFRVVIASLHDAKQTARQHCMKSHLMYIVWKSQLAFLCCSFWARRDSFTRSTNMHR